MKYFGINLGHDSSLAAFDEKGDLFFFAQAERYEPRIKNYEHDLKPIFNAFPNLQIKKEDAVAVCPCFDNFEKLKINPLNEYNDLIAEVSSDYALDRIGNKNLIPKFLIDHHLAHAISSWCFRENDNEKLFLSYDGSGACVDKNKPYKSSLVGIINKKSFCPIDNFEKIPSSMPFNHLLGKRSAGKLMGLAGFLPNSLEKLNQKEFLKWMDLCAESNFIHHRVFPTKDSPNEEDLLLFAKIYNHYTNFIWEKIESNIKKFSYGKEILIGGGTTLALEINTKIFNMTNNLTFGPAADDSGLALGAAAFCYFAHNKKWPQPIKNVNLNNLNENLPAFGPQDPKDIAKLLFKDEVIGIIRDKSECGPRALGFRSILAQATKSENLQRVSEHLKGRENYRPLAPIVTEECFDQYFLGPKGKYMQFKCSCNEHCQKNLPSIVHKDNSSRPQVVSKNEDPWLHDVLVEYGKLSGYECLINTSLNGKNKPICQTYKDAQKDFKNKNINLISIGKNTKRFF
jgi:carbamoyltransferase